MKLVHAVLILALLIAPLAFAGCGCGENNDMQYDSSPEWEEEQTKNEEPRNDEDVGGTDNTWQNIYY